ncbi:solute carrier family 2, facilitated glucose transporter member 7 isoform X2 [Myotis yumanensis]|uniref:solute carrier family 2, facilitated glucose transporter member 7 isoform X2 n=1 Tax=Myotis yumanensis TaxID=159337 RepID=UPI0038D174D2
MEVPSPPREGRLQPTLVLATLSAGFGSAFQYGYNIAVVNTPHKVLKSFYNDTYYARHGTSMDEKHMLLLWSCTVSMFPLGGLLGSLMVGGLVDKCGRKGTLLINNIFAIVPAILMGVSKAAKAFELIILSRVLLGVCAGISYSALPMYLGELAPKNLRGTLGTMTEVFVIVGVFLAQIFSLQPVLGNPTEPALHPHPERRRGHGPTSSEETEGLGRCGGRDRRDARGGPGREGRGPPVRAQPVHLPAPAVAAHLHHRAHGRPAAFRDQRDQLLRRHDLRIRRHIGRSLPVCNRGRRRGQHSHDRHFGRHRGVAGQTAPPAGRLWHLRLGLPGADAGAPLPERGPWAVLPRRHLRLLLHRGTFHWAQSRPLCGEDRDLPAVLPAGSLHGGRGCALAHQLHRGLHVPFRPGGHRGLQFHHLCRNLPPHCCLHLRGDS